MHGAWLHGAWPLLTACVSVDLRAASDNCSGVACYFGASNCCMQPEAARMHAATTRLAFATPPNPTLAKASAAGARSQAPADQVWQGGAVTATVIDQQRGIETDALHSTASKPQRPQMAQGLSTTRFNLLVAQQKTYSNGPCRLVCLLPDAFAGSVFLLPPNPQV